MLINRDLHQDNYLFDSGEAGAIDFDISGWDYPVFDLKVTHFNLFPEISGGREDRPALHDALLEGYASARTLPTGWEQLEALRMSQYLYRMDQRFGWIGSEDAAEREKMRRESVERCRWYLEV